ncbi:MAG: thioredoxin family protein [Flavisolibacter sp.]
MKQFFILLIAGIIAAPAIAQDTQITVESNGTKVINGFFTQQQLASDSAFLWYARNRQGYVPEQNALQALKTSKDSINFIVFGGTWCDDTKSILPKFFALTDAAGFSPERVTMIGVDRSKKTIHHLHEAFNIKNVPTIIVMKQGKEIGRVVEYGRYGMFDKELGEIIAASH